MFVRNKISTQSYSAKFLYWGDHVNSVPDLAASPPWSQVYCLGNQTVGQSILEKLRVPDFLFPGNAGVTYTDYTDCEM